MKENRQKALWAAFAIIAGSLIITVPIAGLLGCSDARAQSVEKTPAKQDRVEVSTVVKFNAPLASLFRDTVTGREWIVFTHRDRMEVRDVTYRECCHDLPQDR